MQWTAGTSDGTHRGYLRIDRSYGRLTDGLDGSGTEPTLPMAASQLSAFTGKPLASFRKRGADARVQRVQSRRSHVVKAGVTVETVREGDGQTFPKPGQVVTGTFLPDSDVRF